MATYATLREHILLALDIDPATTNDDTVDLVNHRMKQVVDRLVTALNPTELLVEKMKNVTSATTSIPLNTSGFLCTDLAEVFAITVDDKTTATRNDVVWTPTSREQWIMSRSLGYGDERLKGTWTQDGFDNFYLSEWPQGSSTWDVYLHYYKQTAAVTDLGEPELPVRYHQDLVVGGTVLGFPQRFQGDRQATLLMFQKEYQDALDSLLKGRKALSQDLQLKTRNQFTTRGIVNWPGFQTS